MSYFWNLNVSGTALVVFILGYLVVEDYHSTFYIIGKRLTTEEFRRESFYIYTADEGRMYVYMPISRQEGGIVEFLITDIPKIRACLDEVEKRTKV